MMMLNVYENLDIEVAKAMAGAVPFMETQDHDFMLFYKDDVIQCCKAEEVEIPDDIRYSDYVLIEVYLGGEDE